MKFKKPENENYCATITKIKTVIPFENCDNIQGTIIFGDSIIIGKDVKVGDIGVYFPAETQLSIDYASKNNLYRHPEYNADPEKKGYLEDNRRIRTMKMRGNKSSGLFMPLESLSFFVDISELKDGDTFDEINGVKICNKYFVKKRNSQGQNQKKGKKAKKVSRLITNQFRFHDDTSQLGKNIHRIKPEDIISITYKLHGTSGISSKVLCKKKLSMYQKLLKMVGGNIILQEPFNLYSSRRVVKNDDMNPTDKNHFYNVDIWGLANEKIKEYLVDGMTAYYEIVGFLPDGAAIQKMKKAFDYGCKQGEWEIYIYRLTYTGPDGHVFEFSAKQVQQWCAQMGLNAVPELYYGKASTIFRQYEHVYEYDVDLIFEDNFLNLLSTVYLEKNCYMCKNKVPAEGIVVRREVLGLEAYKLKSFAFKNAETAQLDKGESNIEDDQGEEE